MKNKTLKEQKLCPQSQMLKALKEKGMSMHSEMFHELAQVFRLMETNTLKEKLAEDIFIKTKNGLLLENLIEEASESQKRILESEMQKKHN